MELEYICQLKDGNMLVRDYNVYRVEHTGYPYPDVEGGQLYKMTSLFGCIEFENYSVVVKNIISYFNSNPNQEIKLTEIVSFIEDCAKNKYNSCQNNLKFCDDLDSIYSSLSFTASKFLSEMRDKGYFEAEDIDDEEVFLNDLSKALKSFSDCRVLDHNIILLSQFDDYSLQDLSYFLKTYIGEDAWLGTGCYTFNDTYNSILILDNLNYTGWCSGYLSDYRYELLDYEDIELRGNWYFETKSDGILFYFDAAPSYCIEHSKYTGEFSLYYIDEEGYIDSVTNLPGDEYNDELWNIYLMLSNNAYKYTSYDLEKYNLDHMQFCTEDGTLLKPEDISSYLPKNLELGGGCEYLVYWDNLIKLC